MFFVFSMAGQIQLIIGPMFSGKTTELMRLLKRYQVAKYRCLVIKYYKDTRYNSDCIMSHDKQHLEAVNVSKLSPFLDTANDYDVIGIDEGQFFTDIVSFADEMAERGKIVLVAALDSTFEKKAFGEILQLIPLAETVVKLTAVCMNCSKVASFTKRIGTEKQVEIIGGADKYLSVCRKCYPLALQSSSPLKESSKENRMVSPQPKLTKKAQLTSVNSQPPTDKENDFCSEDFQPPPLANFKSNQMRGKLFNSQPLTANENDFCSEDFQPPPLANIKSNQMRGKLFNSQPPTANENDFCSEDLPPPPLANIKSNQMRGKLFNSQSPTANENDFCSEDFQPPPLVNIKSNQMRGKLFSSP